MVPAQDERAADPMDRIARFALRAAIAVAIVGAWPGALEPFAPLKATVVRAIGLGLLPWLAVEAWAGRIRKPGLLTWAVLAWLGVNALSTLFSYSPRLSFLGDLHQREGLMLALALASLHFTAKHAHRSETHVRTTLSVAMLAGITSALLAHLQLAGADPFHWAQRVVTPERPLALRPTGTLGDPWLLAVVLAVSLPLALARLSEESKARTDLAMVLLVLGTALLASALVTTLAPGAWLAALLGTSLTLAGTAVAGLPVRRMVWACLVGLLPALLFGMARSAGAEGMRLATWGGSPDGSLRTIVADGAMQLWSGRPWLGVGPDAFGLAYPGVQPPDLWNDSWLALPANAPTVIHQTLATLGIVGALIGLAWVLFAADEFRGVWLGRPAARGTLAGLAGALIALLAAGATSVVGIAGATLFAVFTTLPGSLAERPPVRARRIPPHPLLAPAFALFVTLGVLAAGVTELRALTLAQRSRLPASRARLTPGEWRARTEASSAAAGEAVKLVPGEAELWRVASAASLVAGEAAANDELYESAERAAHRAVALEPRRAESHAQLAEVLAARAIQARRAKRTSLADSANAEFDRALDLAPMDGRILATQARANLDLGDGERAHSAAQQLVALYPQAAISHALAGAAAHLRGMDDVARGELRAAMTSRWEADESEQRLASERLLARLDARAAALAARAPAPKPAPARIFELRPAKVRAEKARVQKARPRPVVPRGALRPRR